MKRLLHFITPLLLLAAVFICKKPAHLRGDSSFLSEPRTFLTSLQDSLPEKALQELQIQRRVLGTKIKYPSGLYASYFEYEVDSKALIRTIGRLPFSRAEIVADTVAHPIAIGEFNELKASVSLSEQEHAAIFWNSSLDNVVVYECFKAPFRHTLLISKTSSRVLHRIALEG